MRFNSRSFLLPNIFFNKGANIIDFDIPVMMARLARAQAIHRKKPFYSESLGTINRRHGRRGLVERRGDWPRPGRTDGAVRTNDYFSARKRAGLTAMPF